MLKEMKEDGRAYARTSTHTQARGQMEAAEVAVGNTILQNDYHIYVKLFWEN
jgi:hypothetical protein